MVAVLVIGVVAGGWSDDPSPADGRTGHAAAFPKTRRMPCDPGGGFPRQTKGCPDANPETGWLTSTADGRLRLTHFRTLGNDSEGEAYAREHGLEFPFSDDHFDAPTGKADTLELQEDAVCTGIIRVHHAGAMEDQVVECSALVVAGADAPAMPIAVWRDGATVVQVSELYRP